MDRRSFLSSGAALGVGSLVLPSLLTMSSAAATLPTLSAATVNATKSALINLYKKANAGTATPTDVQSAATTLSVLFGNMQETKWNAAGTPQFKSAIQTQISKGNPDKSQKVRSLLASNGINITPAQAELYFRPTVSQLQQILSGLSSPGMYSMEQNIAARLATIAKTLEAQGIKTIAASNTSQNKAHLRRVMTNCDFDAFLMGGLGLFSPPPIDFLFGLGSLMYAFMGAMEWC